MSGDRLRIFDRAAVLKVGGDAGRPESAAAGGVAPLLTKTVDTAIIEEQWDAVMRLATSLKDRTTPAHVIVQRLTSSYPADRLSKAITNLGRIIKTEYILRYLNIHRGNFWRYSPLLSCRCTRRRSSGSVVFLICPALRWSESARTLSVQR